MALFEQYIRTKIQDILLDILRTTYINGCWLLLLNKTEYDISDAYQILFWAPWYYKQWYCLSYLFEQNDKIFLLEICYENNLIHLKKKQIYCWEYIIKTTWYIWLKRKDILLEICYEDNLIYLNKKARRTAGNTLLKQPDIFDQTGKTLCRKYVMKTTWYTWPNRQDILLEICYENNLIYLTKQARHFTGNMLWKQPDIFD